MKRLRMFPKGVVHKDANEIMPAKEIFDLKSTYLPLVISGDTKCYMKRKLLGRSGYDRNKNV